MRRFFKPIFRILLTTGLVMVYFNQVHCQDSTVTFYKNIKEDSVVMFFNDSYTFTDISCAENRRFTKIDQQGDFHEAFRDFNGDSTLIARGTYTNGLKNGYFEHYHSNGKLRSKGNYKEDKPTGEWFYYYANGKPERQLLLNVADTFLMQFYDENGVQRVIDGNGIFKGEINANDRFFRTRIIASGRVLNGKPDGEWTSTNGDRPYCTEEFKHGKFVTGHYSTILSGKKKYKTHSYLKKLFLSSYIETLEEFHVYKCTNFKRDPSVRVITIKETENKTSVDNFRSFVNEAIDRVVAEDTRNGNYLDYLMGENILRISFSFTDQLVPTNFKKESSWGDQYFSAITDVLTMHYKTPPTSPLTYFNLTVVKTVGNSIGYQYYFSNN